MGYNSPWFAKPIAASIQHKALKMNTSDNPVAVIMAGIPATNLSLYHRIRFLVGDPAALIALPTESGDQETTLILQLC